MKSGIPRSFLFLAALFLGIAPRSEAAAGDSASQRLLLDAGWRFHLGNEWGSGYGLAKAGTGYGPASISYSDASWRTVDLPHDWAIELPFDQTADGSHGFRAVGEGFPQNSTGWYRRTLELPAADAGKRIWLEFDGVYRDCTVIVNGWFVGHHESGYSGFRYDITDVANAGGKNVISVRVDASLPEGWFYEGAGIYRHVWLVVKDPVSLAPDGVFVFSKFKDNVPTGPAELHVQAQVLNTLGSAADATVTWEVTAPDGTPVATLTQAAHIGASSAANLEQKAKVSSPILWSPEKPMLYRLVTTVSSGEVTVDRAETVFGIRTVGFDADRGFLLNGEPYTLKGTSNHQDHAGVGSALPDAVQYYRIARLKEMGCNAYRTAHNPPTPELLDACDRLGMLVMDENRQLGSDSHHVGLLVEQILRDRNHPSVAIWSLGNEEFEVEQTVTGQRVAATMQAIVKRMDSTRPVTINADLGDVYTGVDAAVEVRGWSYHVGKAMDDYHREHPLQPNVGSEQGSTVSTRGIYANDKVRGYVSAYDDNAPSWAQTAETWVSFFGPRPWMSGGFVWTGFDYRGEPTPYGWPCINSHFGIMDTCGFPKDNFYYYQSQWTSAPMVHILPHWNWPGKEGQDIDVRTQSNCDEVELLLNGQSLGRKPMKKYSEIKWMVPYAPGTLSARAYRAGSLAAESSVETTGAPAQVFLKPYMPGINADGQDAAVFTVAVEDAQGRVVPTAGNTVSFELSGPGKIIGVGNGDPSSHEADTMVPVSVSRMVPVGGWRWKQVADPYPDNMAEEAPAFDDSGWEAVEVSADVGALGLRGRAIYRVRFNVAASDLDSAAVEIAFSKILGGVATYVNGQRVGGSVDPRAPMVYDVKALLHPGENVIAVATANYGPEGAGLSKGVSLRLTESPAPLGWSRSVFNGLAEVIVQATRTPGPIRLTAHAEGLQDTSFTLNSQEAAAKPSVP
jgi:beta-galactosidase